MHFKPIDSGDERATDLAAENARLTQRCQQLEHDMECRSQMRAELRWLDKRLSTALDLLREYAAEYEPVREYLATMAEHRAGGNPQ